MRAAFIKLFAVILISLAAVPASAQQQEKNWREKIKCAKIAYISTEMNLTPEEAQVFWPVYNQAEDAKHKAYHEVIKSYKALKEALASNKKGKEVASLLQTYVNAQKSADGIDASFMTKFLEVLPAEKVARLYIAEEGFRRQQISNYRKKEQ